MLQYGLATTPAERRTTPRKHGENAKVRNRQRARQLHFDPDLQRIVDLWPNLSEAVRRAVLALVEAAPARGQAATASWCRGTGTGVE